MYSQIVFISQSHLIPYSFVKNVQYKVQIKCFTGKWKWYKWLIMHVFVVQNWLLDVIENRVSQYPKIAWFIIILYHFLIWTVIFCRYPVPNKATHTEERFMYTEERPRLELILFSWQFRSVSFWTTRSKRGCANLGFGWFWNCWSTKKAGKFGKGVKWIYIYTWMRKMFICAMGLAGKGKGQQNSVCVFLEMMWCIPLPVYLCYNIIWDHKKSTRSLVHSMSKLDIGQLYQISIVGYQGEPLPGVP